MPDVPRNRWLSAPPRTSRRAIVRTIAAAFVGAGTTARSAAAKGHKAIVVSISQQTLWVYSGDRVVLRSYVSTGRAGFDTPLGSYVVLSKLPTQTMEGVIGGEYYNVPDVPSVMYFTGAGHALHGTYWHNSFGTPMSHGCVNLALDVAAWLYQWAPIGTPVLIVA